MKIKQPRKIKTMRKETDEKLKILDAELDAIYETRDVLTGRLHTMYSSPYEVVIGFPASMGERGFRLSMYYDAMPDAEQIYSDSRIEIKNYIKRTDNYLIGAYEEQAVKIAKKVLRKYKIFSKLTPHF